MTNTATGTVNTAVTDEQGAYSIPFVSVGDYDIVVELTGFKRVEQKSVDAVASPIASNSTSRSRSAASKRRSPSSGGTPLLETRTGVAGPGHRREAHRVDAAVGRQPVHADAPGGRHRVHGRPEVLAAVRQRRHVGDHQQRRGRRQRVHARRLAEHGQWPPRRLHAAGRRGAGVQGRDRDVRRAAGPHRGRDHQRDDEGRHQPVPRRRLLPLPRRDARQERLLPREGRPPEGHARVQALRRHVRRPGRPRVLQRPQQDVLLHRVRVALRPVPRARPVHRADRGAAQRRLLGAAAARHPDLRPGHGAPRQRPGAPRRRSRATSSRPTASTRWPRRS